MAKLTRKQYEYVKRNYNGENLLDLLKVQPENSNKIDSLKRKSDKR